MARSMVFCVTFIWSLFACASVHASDAANSTTVLVQVKQGQLEGELLELATKDGYYYSFKGISYAAPPVGKLRFKAPEPPLSWEGVRTAFEHGPTCPQVQIYTKTLILGNEDCLYLNVYSPDLKPKTPLPVMFFIHGGGFRSGSGNTSSYGPDFLVQRDVVVVTINYRLGPFGFLCLDTKEVPGNAGLKDQVAALKWVQENISKFGGDPDSVTVFSQSAGSACTSLHVLSPMSKGLFKRSILASGVPLNEWSLAFEPARRAITLGKILGFETNDKEELLEFLQSVSSENLILRDSSVLAFEDKLFDTLKLLQFTPVVEKDFGQDYFMIEEPLQILKKGEANPVDVIIGYTRQESLFFLADIESKYLQLYNRFPELLVPRELLYMLTPRKILELSQVIQKHYFDKKPITVNVTKEYAGYASECSFQLGIHRFLDHLSSKNRNNIYFYRFSSVSERNIFSTGAAAYGLTGPAHGDDMMYIFQSSAANLPIDKNSTSYQMIQLACTIYTNFAKYGNPTPDASLGVTWPTYDVYSKSYGEITANLTIGQSLNADMVDFWRSIFKMAEVEF